ncbi:MAG TPA: ATP phosphoribosyltransferase regulatory subunit, partial [Bacteroidota bacterium]|nr:ATP phosphoribosyltransferase regulatory subunit [Bacteroidota bacterium]
RILDSKDETDKELTKDAPLMKDHLCSECATHFEDLQKALRLFAVPFEIDGTIVRGLDYYTKTAFEIVSKDLGSQDALAGGGRYDLLAEELGGKRTPSVGFAAGMERLLMVLEKQSLPQGADTAPRIYIVGADEAGKEFALKEGMSLRRKGIDCEFDLLGRSVKAQMREADRQGSQFVAVIGANELQKGVCEFKNMKTGASKSISISDLGPALTSERGNS